MNDATRKLLSRSFWNSRPDAEAITALINAGADIKARDKYGWTPLHIAARISTVEVVTALIAAGADIEARDGIGCWTPLHKAAMNGTVEVVKALLDAGADITARTKDGQTAYDIARRYNPRLDGTDALALLA